MNLKELSEIVAQRIDEPGVVGRIACNLRDDKLVYQRHHDGREFEVDWRDTGSWWRCTIFLDSKSELCLAQIDLHNDGDVRVELWEPCSVTISSEEGILCLTRYRKSDSKQAGGDAAQSKQR